MAEATAKPSVLIVDDDAMTRELLKLVLKEEGFAIAGEAKDGETALAASEARVPDLVCLDINMPGMGGLETLARLHERNPGLAVVMVTGDATLSAVRSAMDRGAAGFIVKPFSPGTVGEALRHALKTVAQGAFG
jgi:DNA-binding NarL/FixJ family response regulator